jgi:MscS family membrane protein
MRWNERRPELRSRPAAAALTLAVLLMAAPVSAQEESVPPAETAEPAEPATTPESAPPAETTAPEEAPLSSPRGSVYRYLVASREGDWERAAHFLNLSRIPASQRAERGPELARQLKTVLDRELWVDFDLLSPDPEGKPDDGLPPRRDRLGTIRSEKLGQVPLLLERVRDDGDSLWKISASTVAQIDELYDEFGYGALGQVLPPIFFESRLLEIELWQWIGLFGLVLVAWLGSWIAVWVVVAVLRPVLDRSKTDIDDQLFENALGPARLFVALGIFSVLVLALGLSVVAQSFITETEKALAVVSVAWLVLRLIDVLDGVVVSRLKARGQQSATQFVPLGRKTIKVIVVAFAALAALDSFGFDVTALIAGLGIGGLAVALALQKTLENLFGGATILADRPVQVGDFCRFGDKVGTVEEIGLRSTRVRTLDRTLVTVPNAEFSTIQLENFAKRDKIWFHPVIGLRYETTPEQLRYVLVEIRKMLYAHPRVDPEPARIRFTRFGAYSLDLEIFAYVEATDYGEYLEISEDLNLRIMDIVEAAGTGFAFPSNTTYVAKDEGLDADRVRAAEEEVQAWRGRQELFLPGFPEERIRELADTLDYPPEGSPMRSKEAG